MGGQALVQAGPFQAYLQVLLAFVVDEDVNNVEADEEMADVVVADELVEADAPEVVAASLALEHLVVLAEVLGAYYPYILLVTDCEDGDVAVYP